MTVVEDQVYYQDVNQNLDRIAGHLSQWLKVKLLREVGRNWWQRNVRQVLDEHSQQRIDCGQWKDIDDLDLHALLKVLDRNFEFLRKRVKLPRDGRQVVKDMINVRGRCQGHRPAKGNRLLDLERDIDTMRRFCDLIGVDDGIPAHLTSLYDQISRARLESKGVINTAEQEVVSSDTPTPSIDALHAEQSSFWNKNTSTQGLQGVFSRTSLTASQDKAVGALNDFLKDKDQHCFILKGYAGTGKTFVIGGLVEYLRQNHVETVVMAPTGRAANVISSRHQIRAGTIHRSIYAMDNLEEYQEVTEDGNLTFKFYYDVRNNDGQHDTVFIVDEASMLSDVYSEMEFIRFGSGRLLRDLLDYINFDANDYHKKIIFVGDNAQLPPVGMDMSPALNSEYLEKECRLESQEFELSDVVRQDKQSLVLDNATRMRELLIRNQFPSYEFKADAETVKETKPDSFVDEYVRFCGGQPRSDTVILGYSNALVTDYNQAVRKHFFNGSHALEVGDRLIVVRNNYRYEIELYNGQFGTVKSICSDVEHRYIAMNVGVGEEGQRKTEQVKISFRDVEVEFKDLSGTAHLVKCKIIEDLLWSVEAELRSEKTKALYVDFRQRHQSLSPKDPAFKNTLMEDPYFNALQVKFGYAVTCHKAQGGEWDTVYVDFTGQNKLNAGAMRWSYTALTRAKINVVATNALHHDMIKLTKTQKPKIDTAPEQEPMEASTAPPESEINVPAELAGASDVSKQVYLMVQDGLGEGWAISDMKHGNYLEQYRLTQDGKTCLLKLHYNGKKMVSNVRVENASDESVGAEVENALSPLKGQKIRMPEQQQDKGGQTGVEQLTDAHFREFVSRLSNKYADAGIYITDSREHDEYHLKLMIVHGGFDSSVDYYFDKKRKFTHMSAHPSAEPETKRVLDEIHS